MGRPKAPRLPLSSRARERSHGAQANWSLGEGLSRQAKQLQRGQLTLEFLVILAVLLGYLGFSLGVWKYTFDKLDSAAQRIAVNKVADELEFYSRFLSGSNKGASEISVALFPTTRMAVLKNEKTISVRSCSSQNPELSYERDIGADKAAVVAESLEGADCGSYPISGKVQLSVKKTIDGGLEIAGKT